jgi:hypothetical protein
MAGPLEIYDNWFPYLSGIGALADASTVSFQTENKDVDIETIFKGFAGMTPSPLKFTAKVDLFDPVSGSILQALEQAEEDAEVKVLTLSKGSGDTRQVAGYVRNVSGGGGVGDPAKISFDFVGKGRR